MRRNDDPVLDDTEHDKAAPNGHGHSFWLWSADWHKSQHSNPSGDCVELAALGGGGVAVRNSRNPAGGVLVYGRTGMSMFIQAVRAGEFDVIDSGCRAR